MTHKEFFKILIGQPPPEVEFEIEMRCREVKELPTVDVKEYCCDLVKHVKMQDLLLAAALTRISETETKLFKSELKFKKLTDKKPLFSRFKAMFCMFR